LIYKKDLVFRFVALLERQIGALFDGCLAMSIIRGKKIGMSRLFTESGSAVPVTLLVPEDVSTFSVGDKITVSAKSKGKGFAGVMKRWGFHGGPRTHGQSDRQRAPGSIGGGTDPGRVIPGKHMPGRMGGKRVTIQGLKIAEIDEGSGVIKVIGSVPGPRRAEVEIQGVNHEG